MIHFATLFVTGMNIHIVRYRITKFVIETIMDKLGPRNENNTAELLKRRC